MKLKNIIICIFLIWCHPVLGDDFTYGRGTDDCEDNYLKTINGGDEDNNYGTTFQLLLQKKTTIDNITTKPIFRFTAIDSDIAGKTITSATFTVNLAQVGWDHTIYIHRIRLGRDWEELQSTWNIYKTSNNWGTEGASNTSTDIIATATDSQNANGNPANSYLSFDVTADVQAWADGDTNQGWLLLIGTPGTAEDEQKISSSDWFTDALRPYLEITAEEATNPQIIMVE